MAVLFILLIIYRPEGIMGKRELDFGDIFIIPGETDKERRQLLDKYRLTSCSGCFGK